MKGFTGVLVALAILAALIAGAFAIAGNADAAEIGVEGRGVLYAKGSGMAVVEGDGTVAIRSNGTGTVLVTGAERISARGTGHKVDLPDGSVRFTGWQGTIKVIGEDITVRMEGSAIVFRAAGQGTAHLAGHGRYKVGERVGEWSPEGVDIPFGP